MEEQLGRALGKNIQRQMNYPLPPGGKIISWKKTIDTPKTLEESQGNMGFEKLLHMLENLENLMYAQGWKNVQKK